MLNAGEKDLQQHGDRLPGTAEISGTAKQSKRKNLTLTSTTHAEVSLLFHHQNTRKTQKHTGDAKNVKLEDSEPEAPSHAKEASTIRCNRFRVLQCDLRLNPTRHNHSAITYALGKNKRVL